MLSPTFGQRQTTPNMALIDSCTNSIFHDGNIQKQNFKHSVTAPNYLCIFHFHKGAFANCISEIAIGNFSLVSNVNVKMKLSKQPQLLICGMCLENKAFRHWPKYKVEISPTRQMFNIPKQMDHGTPRILSCWFPLVSERRESLKIKSLCLCKNIVVGEKTFSFRNVICWWLI